MLGTSKTELIRESQSSIPDLILSPYVQLNQQNSSKNLESIQDVQVKQRSKQSIRLDIPPLLPFIPSIFLHSALLNPIPQFDVNQADKEEYEEESKDKDNKT
ncbi:MAG: hypothetical protein EZS28_055604, partial [Streblomastix strix]